MMHPRLDPWPAQAAFLILRCSKAAEMAKQPGISRKRPSHSPSESVMLALISSRIPGPVTETVDRDPGILTLMFACARAVRSGAEVAFARRCALARAIGGPNPL